MKTPAIPYARLFDVIGRPRTMDGILFVPAILEIDKPAEEFHQTLEDYLFSDDALGKLKVAGEDLRDHCVAWTRARIPPLFHFRPPLDYGQSRHPLNAGFLAVGNFSRSAFLTAWPFACVNQVDLEREEDSIGILFSRLGPGRKLRDRITRTFWRLLLQAPEELATFEDYSGAYSGTTIVGYTGTQFLQGWGDFYDYGDGGIDQHTFLRGEHFRCYDCDGSGIEVEYPYTEDCATCGGRGYITWRFHIHNPSNRWDETALEH